MINLFDLNKYRLRTRQVIDHYGWEGDETCGVFVLPSPIDRAELHVIASIGSGWEHVSVSRRNRCPNWPEMSFIHRMFFRPDEACMQLHVPVTDHINVHPYCLHIWRPVDGRIPLPPSWMVGGDGAEEAARLALAGEKR